MDTEERIAVRRKMPVMAEILDFSPASQKEYRSRGLLTDEMVAKIMMEKTKVNQVYRFLELLSKENLKDPFKKLLELMEDLGHRWLAYEMSADARAEKQELMVDEYVYRESGILVHSHFGQCMRISEVDKKDIQLMLSWRFQIAKEAWSSQLETCEAERSQLLKYQDKTEEKISSVGHQMRGFLDKYLDYLDVRAASLSIKMKEKEREQEKEDYKLRKKAGDEQYHQCESILGELFEDFMKMLERTTQSLVQHEEERARCRDVLDKPDSSMPLDISVSNKILELEEQRKRAQQEADDARQEVAAYKAMLEELREKTEKEAKESAQRIQRAEDVMKRANGKNKELATSTTDFLRKRKESQNDAKTWKLRCMMLEKTRKLGYYYPGWFDHLYGICDIHYVRDTEENKRPTAEKLISPKCRCLTSPTTTRSISVAGTSSCSGSSKYFAPSSPTNAKPSNAKNGKSTARRSVKITPGSTPVHYSIHGLNNVSGLWKNGKLVIRKNEFSKNTGKDDGEAEKRGACNGLKCNYLHNSSKNCDNVEKKDFMSTI